MANDAQLVNNINTLFLAAGDRFTVTPVFHVFDMYAPHQGGTSVRIVPSVSSLSGSCSVKNNRAVLTVVNRDIQNAQETAIDIRNRRLTNVRATVLTSTDIHAHNTFDTPHALEPKPDNNVNLGSPLNYTFAPASVTRLDLDLA
jgi:alpha-N-arabinofuranosidase